MADTQHYIFTEAESSPESARLALLEAAMDPGSIQNLGRLSIDQGARCLEVGAGRGSVARWLSQLVGPSGAVVAADIDCRFLTDMPDNVEVRQLDIRNDDLELGSYDVVHCRALLGHLPDPAAAVQRMAAALRPGGILLTEEPDAAVARYYGHPDAEWASDLWRRQAHGMRNAKIADSLLGSVVPALLLAAGLELTGAVSTATAVRAGDPLYDWWRVTLDAFGSVCIPAGLTTEDDQARVMRVMDSPSTILMPFAAVAAWATRPLHDGLSAV